MDEVRRTDDGQAIGLVELGVEMCERAGLCSPKTLKDAIAIGDDRVKSVAEWMVATSMRWLTFRDVLVGMACVFAGLHMNLAESDRGSDLLSKRSKAVLKHIAEREMNGLAIAKDEIWDNERRRARFAEGMSIARDEISPWYIGRAGGFCP
jgi:hypothetical protein